MARFVFTIGLPGAGKSTVSERIYPEARLIDPDAIKAAHPQYDPKAPEMLHKWSKMVAEDQFAEALRHADRDHVLGGTGHNVEMLIRRMRRAKAAGFEVGLLYVAVSLETALERNAARERTIPEEIIREKAEGIYTAFELAAREADHVEMIWNE